MSISPGWAGTAGSDCGSDCGKRLATAVLKRLATAVLEEVRRVLEERIGSGGNKVVQFMACTHRPGLQLRTPARQTKRSHPDSDRASATLHVHESRTRDLVSRSCGSSA